MKKIADMNTRYYDLRGEIVKAERRIAVLTERGEMWAQYNEYKTIHKQLAKGKAGEAGTVRAAPQPGTDPL